MAPTTVVDTQPGGREWSRWWRPVIISVKQCEGVQVYEDLGFCFPSATSWQCWESDWIRWQNFCEVSNGSWRILECPEEERHSGLRTGVSKAVQTSAQTLERRRQITVVPITYGVPGLASPMPRMLPTDTILFNPHSSPGRWVGASFHWCWEEPQWD